MQIHKQILTIVIFTIISVECVIKTHQNVTNFANSCEKCKKFNINYEKITQNFVLNFNHRNISDECRSAHDGYRNSAKNLEYWALKSK